MEHRRRKQRVLSESATPVRPPVFDAHCSPPAPPLFQSPRGGSEVGARSTESMNPTQLEENSPECGSQRRGRCVSLRQFSQSENFIAGTRKRPWAPTGAVSLAERSNPNSQQPWMPSEASQHQMPQPPSQCVLFSHHPEETQLSQFDITAAEEDDEDVPPSPAIVVPTVDWGCCATSTAAPPPLGSPVYTTPVTLQAANAAFDDGELDLLIPPPADHTPPPHHGLAPSQSRDALRQSSTATAIWSQEQYIATQDLNRVDTMCSLQDRTLDETDLDDMLLSSTPNNQLRCQMDLPSAVQQATHPLLLPPTHQPCLVGGMMSAYMTPQVPERERDLRTQLHDELESYYPTARKIPAQPITQLCDSLFIGGFPSEETLHTLRTECNVTHLVNACSGQITYAHSSIARTHFTAALEIPALDATDYFILAHDLEPFTAFVDAAINGGGKVFVHCRAGVNRSVTLCVAYLILRHHFGVLEAVRHFRAKGRPNILDNKSFRNELVEYSLSLQQQIQNHQPDLDGQ